MSEHVKGAVLRALLARPEPLLLPGAHDALSARLAQQAGFEAVYLSGSAMAMSLLGLPDLGLVTATELIEQTRRVVESIDIPLVCDADTGYGNALNVARTIRALEMAGVAAVQLEDQVFPKRCGHFEGKEVISQCEMARKIRAAVDARRSPDTLVIARTDARARLGLDVAIERALAYHEAGADILFIEAPQSVQELRQIAARIPAPLLVNVVEGGKTPQLEFDEYARLGFRIVLYPTAAVRVVANALRAFYSTLRGRRSTRDLLASMVSFEERNEINNLERYLRLERRYTMSPSEEIRQRE